MSYRRFAAHAPDLHTVTCRAVEETDEAMRELVGLDLELRQLGDGPFCSDLSAVRCGETVLYWQRLNRAFQTVLHPPHGCDAIVLPVHDGGEIQLSGDTVSNTELLVMPKGSEADVVSSIRAGADCIFLAEGRLQELLETLYPDSRTRRLTKAAIVSGNAVRLRSIHKEIAELMASSDASTNPNRVDHLVAEAIVWIGEAANSWRPVGSGVSASCRQVAKRAQKIIEERFRRSVHLQDLCKAAGVSMRCLQRSFRDYFNLSISDYLKAVRLNGARRELVAADPDATTVSAIARNNGLPHAGRFSVEFRKRFGECPSAVLAG